VQLYDCVLELPYTEQPSTLVAILTMILRCGMTRRGNTVSILPEELLALGRAGV
jgi:hypothetical protein